MRFAKYLSVPSVIALTGCLQVLGLGDYKDGAGGKGEGGGTSATSTATGSEGTHSTADVSGSTGTGGQSGCTPGATTACYDGPTGTDQHGDCKQGTHTCQQDGMTFTACTGEVTPTTEVCTTKGDEDCNGFACSDTVWADTFGDPANQAITAIARDPAGNVYVGGQFQGTMSIAGSTLMATHGAGDIFFVKIGPDGMPMWAKAFGSPGVDYVFSMAATATGLVVLGGSSTGQSVDFGGSPSGPDFVASFTPAGDISWTRNLGTGSYIPNPPAAVGLDSAGNILVAANIAGTINLGNGNIPGSTNNDIVVAKLTSAGAYVWGQRYFSTTNKPSGVSGLAVDSSDNVYISGSIYGDTNFNGSVITATDRDPLIVKIKGDGTSILWKKSLYGVGDGFTNGIAVDSLGGPVIVGGFAGALNAGSIPLQDTAGDLFIAKYGSNGALGWTKQFGDTAASESIRDVNVDGADHVLITGAIASTVAFGTTTLTPTAETSFVAKYDAGGNSLWARLTMSGSTVSGGNVINHNDKNQVLTAGGFQGSSVDFGLGPVTGLGNADAYVLEIDP